MPSQGTAASILTSKLQQYSALPSNGTDPESLIQFALTLQGRIFPPLLAASAAMFCLALVPYALLKLYIRKGQQAMPKGPPAPVRRRTERYRKWTLLLFWAATGLALASAVAATQTAAAIQFVSLQPVSSSNGTVSTATEDGGESSPLGQTPGLFTFTITAGKVQQALQWSATACVFIFSLATSAMHSQSFVKDAHDPYLGRAPLPPLPKPGGSSAPPAAAAKPPGPAPKP